MSLREEYFFPRHVDDIVVCRRTTYGTACSGERGFTGSKEGHACVCGVYDTWIGLRSSSQTVAGDNNITCKMKKSFLQAACILYNIVWYSSCSVTGKTKLGLLEKQTNKQFFTFWGKKIPIIASK